MKSNVKMAYKRIEDRRLIARSDYNHAIRMKQWDKATLLEGLESGLELASKIIREECPETVHL